MWLTTKSRSDSREPIPLHSCAVWALQFTCHVQTCSGHRCICTCRGSYERGAQFVGWLVIWFVLWVNFPCLERKYFIYMGNLWKLDIFVSIYFKPSYVDTAGNNMSVFGKVEIDDALAEIIRFLDRTYCCNYML